MQTLAIDAACSAASFSLLAFRSIWLAMSGLGAEIRASAAVVSKATWLKIQLAPTSRTYWSTYSLPAASETLKIP